LRFHLFTSFLLVETFGEEERGPNKMIFCIAETHFLYVHCTCIINLNISRSMVCGKLRPDKGEEEVKELIPCGP